MSNLKEIVVTVAGHAGSGKSTVTRIIAEALSAAKLNYDVPDLKSDDGYHYTRVEALKRHGIHILVKEKQRRRASTPKPTKRKSKPRKRPDYCDPACARGHVPDCDCGIGPTVGAR